MSIEKEPIKEHQVYELRCDNHGFVGYSTSKVIMGHIVEGHMNKYGCFIENMWIETRIPETIYNHDA